MLESTIEKEETYTYYVMRELFWEPKIDNRIFLKDNNGIIRAYITTNTLGNQNVAHLANHTEKWFSSLDDAKMYCLENANVGKII